MWHAWNTALLATLRIGGADLEEEGPPVPVPSRSWGVTRKVYAVVDRPDSQSSLQASYYALNGGWRCKAAATAMGVEM